MPVKYQSQQPVNKQYQLIKLAWNNYQSAPEELEPDALAKVEQQVELARQIMTAVLASEEAQQEQVKEEEIEFIFEQLKEQFDSEESFELSLEQQELTEDGLKQAIYQDLLCEKTIDTQSLNYPHASEQEVEEYYHKHRERFFRPERRKVSHILITINDEYPENRREQALSRIEGIRKQLAKNLKKFAKMAVKYSECPTSLNDGLVGEVSRGQLYPELDEVLFTMQPQTLSSVVETEVGFHLLLCHEIFPGGEMSKVDALQAISTQLNQHRKKKYEKKWLSSLLAAQAQDKSH